MQICVVASAPTPTTSRPWSRPSPALKCRQNERCCVGGLSLRSASLHLLRLMLLLLQPWSNLNCRRWTKKGLPQGQAFKGQELWSFDVEPFGSQELYAPFMLQFLARNRHCRKLHLTFMANVTPRCTIRGRDRDCALIDIAVITNQCLILFSALFCSPLTQRLRTACRSHCCGECPSVSKNSIVQNWRRSLPG